MIFDESYLLSDYEFYQNLNESIDIKSFKNELKTRYDEERLTPQFIKDFLTKLYRQKPEDMIDNIPGIGEIIRMTIVIGIPAYINPLYGVFAFIVDKILKDCVNAKLVDKYIIKYKSQLTAMENKISHEKNIKKKAELEKFKKELEEGIKKLENKRDDLHGYKDRDKTVITEIIKENDISDLENVINESFKERRIIRKHNIKQAENKVDEKFEECLEDTKKVIVGDDREEIIRSAPPKLSKLIKMAAGIGIAYSINPTIAVMGTFMTVLAKKKLTEKEKMKILKEINEELEMIDEKIRDADSNGDKKKKYELMRLKNKLLTDRDRIKNYI